MDQQSKRPKKVPPSKAASVMFTIEQINDLHDRLGSAKTLPE
jgi:hypothetical protein